MDEAELRDDVRVDGERIQVVAAHRVVDPVEHARQHAPVTHDALDGGVGVRLPSNDIGGQVPLHPISFDDQARIRNRGTGKADPGDLFN